MAKDLDLTKHLKEVVVQFLLNRGGLGGGNGNYSTIPDTLSDL